jgi:hypothetical protein
MPTLSTQSVFTQYTVRSQQLQAMVLFISGIKTANKDWNPHPILDPQFLARHSVAMAITLHML